MADTYINTTGSISVGSTAGSGQSLNILRNFRSGSGVNVNTSVDFLRTFYRDKTQSNTDPRSYNRPMAFTGFRGAFVYRIDIVTFQNCSNHANYHDATDGVLQLRVTGGTGGTFTILSSAGNRTIASGAIATWNNLAGTYGSNYRGDYTLSIYQEINGIQVVINADYMRCFENGYGQSNISFESINFYNGSSFYNKGN